LDSAVEQLSLSLVGAQLIAENADLIAKDLDLLLYLNEIDSGRRRIALFAAVDLVETGGQGDEGAHRENDQKPQSYVPAAHTVNSDNPCDIRGLAITPYGILAGCVSRQAAFVRGTGRRVIRRQGPWILAAGSSRRSRLSIPRY